jgi:transcriptional regulator with XRE-family HTH domain
MSLMAEQQQRSELADLLRERRAALGISLRTLADRSIDPETGEAAKFGWIGKVENGKPTDAPTPAQLRGLAVGLELPARALQKAAAAQYLGLAEVWSGDQNAHVLVARIEEMSPEDLAQLAAIAETFASVRRAKGQ